MCCLEATPRCLGLGIRSIMLEERQSVLIVVIDFWCYLETTSRGLKLRIRHGLETKANRPVDCRVSFFLRHETVYSFRQPRCFETATSPIDIDFAFSIITRGQLAALMIVVFNLLCCREKAARRLGPVPPASRRENGS